MGNFWNIFQNFISPMGLSRAFIGGVHTKSTILEVFWEYLTEFLIFLYEIFFGSKILSSACLKYQKFDYGCSGNEAPDFGRFWRFWTFFELFVLTQAFSLVHWFLYIFACSKRFFHHIKLWANNQYNADQIFVKSTLCSAPSVVPLWVVLIRKTWNLVSV